METKCICTVLLITYNHASTICRALDSILAQKTSHSFKIHIFDDHSTDETTEKIKEYACKFPEKIKLYISEKNLGPSENVWLAYNSVDTKYCAILEGDDYWSDEEKLELQISALEKHPECSSCAGNTIMYNIGDKYENIKNGTLLISKKLMGQTNIFDTEILKGKYCGYINHISSRMINMGKVDLEKLKYHESFCYDNAQFFYLLSIGPVFMFDRIFSTRVITGKGFFSSKKINERIRKHIDVLMDINIETEYKVEQLVYEHLADFIGYFMHKLQKKQEENKFFYKLNWNIKRIKHYFLPPFIIDFLNLPRDTFRLLQRLQKRRKNEIL